MNNEEFRKERENTLIGKLAKGTLYEQYAMRNKILDKNDDFIEKKTGSAKFSFAFYYQGQNYGVWNDFFNGKVFVSYDVPPDPLYQFALTLKDHRPNTMMLSAMKRYNFWKMFLQNFKLGNVCFENQKIKHTIYEVIKLYHSL